MLRCLIRLICPALLLACLSAPARCAPPPVLLVLGDSLSAGYGIAQGRGWVDLLAARLRAEGRPDQVINASVSGMTAAEGAQRLPALLAQYRPRVVLIELGANDGLRGTPAAALAASLDRLLEDCRRAGARALLVGMRLPPNYGPDYTRRFAAQFGEAARRHHAALVPFLLEGFAQRTELFQADGLHPLAEAQPLMLDTIWPPLRGLLRTPAGGSGR